jgi:hypothetical protein
MDNARKVVSSCIYESEAGSSVVHKLCYDSYCSTIGGITKPRLINYQSNISDKQVTFWQLAWSELILSLGQR